MHGVVLPGLIKGMTSELEGIYMMELEGSRLTGAKTHYLASLDLMAHETILSLLFGWLS